MLNDTPVACQIREPTDPQGDRWRGEAVTDEVLPPSPLQRQGQFRAPAQALHLSPTAPFLPTAEEMGERTLAETTFLQFLSALCPTAISRVFSRAWPFITVVGQKDCVYVHRRGGSRDRLPQLR